MFNLMRLQSEAKANRELLSTVTEAMLLSSKNNATEMRVIGAKFKEMSDDFEKMAMAIDDRNQSINESLQNVADLLMQDSKIMMRNKAKKGLVKASERIKRILK